MKRQVILDTETTGLYAKQGDRLVEIAAIEVVDRRPTGKSFHRYLNPECSIHEKAIAVHGLTEQRLANEPLFAEIADELIAFISDCELLMHNAPFDVSFLDAELARVNKDPIASICTVVDTLTLARRLRPNKINSLDALCKEFEIDDKHRTLHGAMIDAQLLLEVYLLLTRGQESFSLDQITFPDFSTQTEAENRIPLRIHHASEDEYSEHQKLMAEIAAHAAAYAQKIIEE